MRLGTMAVVAAAAACFMTAEASAQRPQGSTVSALGDVWAPVSLSRPDGLSASPMAATCRVPRTVTARQVVLVRASGTRATVRACTRRANGTYAQSLGPFNARVGYNGMAPKGEKREGDGRTPTGVFKLRTGFGSQRDPGVRTGWFRVTSRDVWVDDSASALYNTRQRTPVRGRWTSAEKLLVPAYKYAQVIGYNEAGKPRLGSAIFLHVNTGGATAGCVSLSERSLLRILRWQRVGAVIAIS